MTTGNNAIRKWKSCQFVNLFNIPTDS